VRSTSTTWRPLRGDVAIPEAEFYTLVGRDDLAANARSRRRAAVLGVTLGSVAAAVGSGLLFYGISRTRETTLPASFPGGPPIPFTEGYIDGPMAVAGSVLATVGTIGVTVGLNRGRRRSTHAQAAAEKADRYNARLAESLAAPAADGPTTDI
jgi:hypothetical protein